MTNPKKVILNVDPEKTAEWDEYADEHYSSRSQLIRVAVAKEIDDDNRAGEIPDDLASQLSTLTEGIQQVTNRLDRMNDRLNDLEQRAKQESAEIEELAGDVFEVLPTETELITETHDPVIPTENSSEIGHVKTGRVDHIATKLGVQETRVGEALQKLQTDTALVHSKSIDGQTRYYKEV